MSARGPTSERQEDFKVQWSLLLVPGRGDECSEFFDIPTVKRLLAISLKNVVVSECRVLFDTQLMFLKNEIEPTTKMHDDDERIGSLTEAITDHFPAGQVTRQARVKVGATNCSGMISWSAVRKSAGGPLPKHAAVGGWKLRALSFFWKKE